MNLPEYLSKHFREVFFGGNWTWSNLKDTLEDVSWEQANARVYNLNTIAALAYHINYYVRAVAGVLKEEPLGAKDEFSFDHPPIKSQRDWEKFVQQVLEDGESFTYLVGQLPEAQLWETFSEEKHSNYYRNIQGVIEHTHYHLGQIAIIKKILAERKD
jgi:uncharacterized damage-inducible protein DinB